MNLKSGLAFIGAFGLLSGRVTATQLIDPPSTPAISNITIFVAKKIVTMDPAIPNATAVAVADGRILLVGSLEDMKPWSDKYPTQIDRQFEHKVMYPGFVEPHAHPLLAGILFNKPLLTPSPMPNPWGPAFPGVPNLQAAMQQLRKYSDAIKDPNQTLLAWGYDVVAMGKVPDRQMLDQVSMTRPIIVWDASGHDMYVNSAMIKHYGITPDKVKSVKGVGIDKDGQLNGQFLEIPAISFILAVAGKDVLNPSEIPGDYLYMSDLMQQGGITTSGDLAFGTLNIETETKVVEAFTHAPEGALRIVPVVYADPFIQKYGANAIQAAQDLRKLDNDRLIFQGVKFYSDGGFTPVGAGASFLTGGSTGSGELVPVPEPGALAAAGRVVVEGAADDEAPAGAGGRRAVADVVRADGVADAHVEGVPRDGLRDVLAHHGRRALERVVVERPTTEGHAAGEGERPVRGDAELLGLDLDRHREAAVEVQSRDVLDADAGDRQRLTNRQHRG